MQHLYSSADLGRDKGRHWQDLVSEVFCPVNVDIGGVDTSRFPWSKSSALSVGTSRLHRFTTDPEWARREKESHRQGFIFPIIYLCSRFQAP